MRNILLVLAGAGLIYFCAIVLVDWYNGVEADVNHRNEVKSTKIEEASGYSLNSSGKPSGTAAGPISGSSSTTPTQTGTSSPGKSLLVIPRIAVSPTSQPNVVVTLKDIDAFSPTNPNQLIGRFNKDTRLSVGSKDLISGKYFVVYEPKGGKPITALCKAEDLGR